MSEAATVVGWAACKDPVAVKTRTTAALPRIGPYQLTEQIGEGGFGIVYRAEQSGPIHREVALKIIKPGMSSRDIIRRFEAERHALALMEHPNIAAVFDAGTADSGLPYFVMELVRGLPMTIYCDQHKLTIRQRLELFIPVCHAVQHAHQKAILHRDLKPSNILVAEVDGKAVPKVIDFGVAKAIGTDVPSNLHDSELRTLAGSVIGTPQYMSPEQAGAKADLDTRSDIFTLGVILYELLTGEPPLSGDSLRKGAVDELLRMIREVDPPRPSSRLTPFTEAKRLTAASRQSEPARLSRQLRGDLDWVILKTLEKERERRYDSAAALADDLERYLAHEPVAAGPPGVIYRFRKLVRRNRLAFGATAVVFTLLLAGIGVSTWQWRVALRERSLKQAEFDRAEQESAVSKAVSEFLTKDLLGASKPTNEPDRDIKVRTLLDRAASTIGDRFSDQPLVEAEINCTLGECYLSLMETAQGLEFARRGAALFQSALGPVHVKTLGARLLVADIRQTTGDLSGLELEYQEILRALERACGPEDSGTLRARMNLAGVYYSLGKLDASEAMFRSALETHERVFGKTDDQTLRIRTNLANILVIVGNRDGLMDKYQEAEMIYRDLLNTFEQVQKFPTDLTVWTRSNLAITIEHQNRPAEAESEYRAARNLAEKVFGPSNQSIIDINESLINCLVAQGKMADAIKIWEDSLVVARSVFGSAHPRVFEISSGLAGLLQGQGQLAEAINLQEGALADYRRELQPGDRIVASALRNLATLYEQAANPRKAAALRDEYLQLRQSPDPPAIPTGTGAADPSKPWRAVFFNWTNTSNPCDDLEAWRRCAEGESAVFTDLPELAFDFGMGPPKNEAIGSGNAMDIRSDHFGMIAIGRLRLGQGRWRIQAETDDGLRLWANGRLIINEWEYPQGLTCTGVVEQNLPEETDTEIIVEYFENTGAARIKLTVVRE